MNRRDLLKRAGAAIIPAAILASRLPTIDILRQPGTSRIAAVVYDERYSDCRSFAEALARHGAIPFPVNGDCGRLWHGALRQHLVQNRGSVAGLTTDSDFVVSHACGRELGLSAAYEGTHDGRTPSYISHHLRGRGHEREFAGMIQRDEKHWSESVADALPGILWLDDEKRASEIRRTLVDTRSSPSQGLYLVSWLLESA